MELDKQLTSENTKENFTTTRKKIVYDNCGHELALYCIHSESKLEEILNITKKEE